MPPLAYATPPKSPLGTPPAGSLRGATTAPPGALASPPSAIGHRPAPMKCPFNSPPLRQHPPPLDFSGKKFRNDQPSRPTTEDITTKKPITVRLYPTLDLPMPTPTNEHRALVIFDKSEDSLPPTNSESTRSTTPNPKWVKYEITGRQLLHGITRRCSTSSTPVTPRQ